MTVPTCRHSCSTDFSRLGRCSTAFDGPRLVHDMSRHLSRTVSGDHGAFICCSLRGHRQYTGCALAVLAVCPTCAGRASHAHGWRLNAPRCRHANVPAERLEQPCARTTACLAFSEGRQLCLRSVAIRGIAGHTDHPPPERPVTGGGTPTARARSPSAREQHAQGTPAAPGVHTSRQSGSHRARAPHADSTHGGA